MSEPGVFGIKAFVMDCDDVTAEEMTATSVQFNFSRRGVFLNCQRKKLKFATEESVSFLKFESLSFCCFFPPISYFVSCRLTESGCNFVPFLLSFSPLLFFFFFTLEPFTFTLTLALKFYVSSSLHTRSEFGLF